MFHARRLTHARSNATTQCDQCARTNCGPAGDIDACAGPATNVLSSADGRLGCDNRSRTSRRAISRQSA